MKGVDPKLLLQSRPRRAGQSDTGCEHPPDVGVLGKDETGGCSFCTLELKHHPSAAISKDESFEEG
jgi:hypothetical protein